MGFPSRMTIPAIVLPWLMVAFQAVATSNFTVDTQRQIAAAIAAGENPAELLRQIQTGTRQARPQAPKPLHGSEFNAQLAQLRLKLKIFVLSDPVPERRLTALFTSYRSAQAAHLLMQQRFETVNNQLEQSDISPTFNQRLAAAKAAYLDQAEPLFAALAPLWRRYQAAEDKSALAADESFIEDLREIAGETIEQIQSHSQKPAPRILGSRFLPYRTLSLSQRSLPGGQGIQPSYLNPDDELIPEAEDLATTIDAPLSDEILAQAKALDNDYIRIFEFVNNNIKTQWYAGSMKGAVGTLRQRAGNDIDQANLLIALFRASGLASRYVHGVIKLPIEAVQDSLGLSTAEQATRALNLAGVAYRPVIRGGRVAAVNIEHTWVSAYVPYTNYRGAMVDTSGSVWLPLTPALKNYSLTAATGIYQQAQLNTNTLINDYLAQAQSDDLITQIRNSVEQYLQLNQPESSLAEQLGDISVKPQSLGLLPNTMPVPVVMVQNEEAELSDDLRHRIRITARNGNTDASNIVLDYTAALSELASQRATLSYIPATIDDQKTTNLFGGLDLVPAYLIKLKPQIKINGRQIAVAAASVDTGITHRFDIEVINPNGREIIEEQVIAGSYHAVAIVAGEVAQQSTQNNEACSDALDAGCIEPAAPSDTEYLGASLLSRIAYEYSKQWSAAEDELAGLLNVALVRPLPSIAVASNDMRVDTVLGQVDQINWQAVTLDAAMRVAQPIVRSETSTATKDFMRLAALQGSTLEHRVFEELFLVQSVSADKGLQFANQSGANVVTLDSGNYTSQKPSLSHPVNVIAEFDNWIAKGFTITTPTAVVNSNDWSGHVWQVEDLATGSGGYYIAGGLAGGATSQSPGNWVLDWLRDALAAANTPPPNLNPGKAASVTVIPHTDGQFGVVGKPLNTPLAVMVRDQAGSPVKGAKVTFQLMAGGGSLSDGNSAVVLTDVFGIASTPLTLGTSTNENPAFIKRNSADKFATRAAVHYIEVSTSSDFGRLTTARPMSAIAFPDTPVEIVLTYKDDSTSHNGFSDVYRYAGQYLGALYHVVTDQFLNPVANVPVTYASGETEKWRCLDNPDNPGLGGGGPPPALLVDARDDALETDIIIYGDGGSSSQTLKSSGNGLTAVHIYSAPNMEAHTIVVSAAGIPTEEHRFRTDLSDDLATWNFPGCTPLHRPGGCNRIAIFNKVQVDEDGIMIAAARPRAEPKARPIFWSILGDSLSRSVRFTNSDEEFGWERLTKNRAEQVAVVHTAEQIQKDPLLKDGAIVLETISNAKGIYESRMNVPPETGYELLQTRYYGHNPEMDVCESDWRGEFPHDKYIFTLTVGPWSVEPTVDSFISQNVPAGTDSNVIYVDKSGVNLYPVEVAFDVEPAEYRALYIQLEIFEDGVAVDRFSTGLRQGSGKILIPPGQTFELGKNYTAQLVLNRGIDSEVRSDLIEMPIRSELILDYTRSVHIKQDIDILNQRNCNVGTDFKFTLAEEALVTLAFVDETNPDQSTKLIDNALYPEGESSIDISVSNLNPGRYRFTLTAESVRDNLTDTEQGLALVEFTTQNNLPVGHTIVKGVDVFDGNLSLSSNDMSIPGRGAPLEFRRSYSSNASSVPGSLGVGWNHNYNSRIVITPCNEVIVIGAAGGGIRFVSDGDDGLLPLRGYHGALIQNEADRSFDFFTVDGTRYHYRNHGRRDWDLVVIEDTNGNVSKLGYDPSSPEVAKLQTVEDSAGRLLEFEYEDREFKGNTTSTLVITQIRATADSVELMSINYGYDQFGDLVNATRKDSSDNDIRVESYNYNKYELDDNGEPVLGDDNLPVLLPIHQRHKLNRYTDPNGNITTYEYEASVLSFVTDQGEQVNAPYSSIKSVTEPESGATRFTYSFADRNTAVTNPRDYDNGFRMNSYGSVEELTRIFGVTQTGWTADDVLPLNRIDANNVQAEFTYDVDGNIETETVAGEFQRRFTYRDFDGNTIKNRIATQRDRNGHLTQFEYDAKGNLKKVTDPEGGVTEHTYYANGDRATTKDPEGNITQFKYDQYGNVEKVIDAKGNVTTTQWNARSLPERIVDARGHVTINRYDDLGRLLEVENHFGDKVTFTYDNFGNKLTETDERGYTTKFFYDAENRLRRVENPLYEGGDTHYQEFDYDDNGNKTLERDWNGNVTTFEYDADDRLHRRTEPEGRVTEFGYDAVGNKTSETIINPDGDNQVTGFDYNDLNQLIERTDAEGGVTQFTYDGEGNKLTETDAEGRLTTFEYDKNNRLKVVNAPEGRTTQFGYDKNGNKISETDGNGHTTTFAYDALNRLINIIDADGKITTNDYDAVGNLISVIDANLHETRHTYDALNRRKTTTDPRGFVTEFDYDAVGNLKEERLPNTNVVIHTYDKLNRLTRSEDNLGQILTKDYDANGNVIEQHDANDNVTVNIYDGLNRLKQQNLPEDRIVQFDYDVFGNKVLEIDARQHETRFAYDRLNRLIRETDPDNFFAIFGYDKVGNKISETDKRNNVTKFDYDDANRLIKITDALDQEIIMDYDLADNKVLEIDKRGTQTIHTYDKLNRLETTTKDNVLILSLAYDNVGNKVLEQDANGNKVVFVYDERNQVTEESRPLAAITRFRYNAMGDKEWQRDPEGNISEFGYDLRRRLSSQTNGETEVENFTYDGNGNRKTLERPDGNTWEFEYDGADRLLRVTDAMTGQTTYTYDKNSNRETQTDGENNTTTFEYDKLNRREKIIYADITEITFSYDANGNRTGMIDANGLSFTFVYDELNRETEKQYPAPATPTGDDIQTIINDYDENNNLTQITETYSGATGTRTTTQRFDNFDRLYEKTDPQGETIRYTYDANGNRKTVKDPDGKVTTYNYDALNRVDTVTNQQGITKYDYYRNSLKQKVSYPNGTQSTFEYDRANRVTKITNTQNTAVVSSYEYDYDNNGNRIEQIEVNGAGPETTTYDFDDNDRLTEVVYPDQTTIYTYDDAYNRKTEITTQNTGNTETTNKTYTYNNRNQVTDITESVSGDQTNYDYDDNGNRTRKTVTPAAAGVQTTLFVYDVRDQLRTITQGGSNIGQFLYDYQGLRIRKQTQTETTRYVYDDQSVLIQTDDAGNTTAKYDYGPDRLLSLTHNTEGAQFYLFDALGSVVNLTKPDGAIQARYQYDAWGNYRNQVGSSANVFGFTGHEMDGESNLIYMKARFYDASCGCFLTQDAFEGEIDLPPSLHKYLYAFGNPTVFIDLDGNQAVPLPPAVQVGTLEAGGVSAAGAACQTCQQLEFDSTNLVPEEIAEGVNRIPGVQLLSDTVGENLRNYLIINAALQKLLLQGFVTTEDAGSPGTSGGGFAADVVKLPSTTGLEPPKVDPPTSVFPAVEQLPTKFENPTEKLDLPNRTEFPDRSGEFGPNVVFSEKSRGEIFEETVKERFRGKIIRENEELFDDEGNIIGEIDFETEEAIVEVGLSLGKKSKQLFQRAEEAERRKKRLDVIFGPETPPARAKELEGQLRKKFGNRVRFIPQGE